MGGLLWLCLMVTFLGLYFAVWVGSLGLWGLVFDLGWCLDVCCLFGVLFCIGGLGFGVGWCVGFLFMFWFDGFGFEFVSLWVCNFI